MVSSLFSEVLAEVDAKCRERSIPMLGPQKAARLVELVREAKPDRVVEVGTAIGYSGLCVADTVRSLGKGHLVTIELDPARAAEAAGYFRRAAVDPFITQLIG